MIGTAVDQKVAPRFKRSTGLRGGGNSTLSEFDDGISDDTAEYRLVVLVCLVGIGCRKEWAHGRSNAFTRMAIILIVVGRMF